MSLLGAVAGEGVAEAEPTMFSSRQRCRTPPRRVTGQQVDVTTAVADAEKSTQSPPVAVQSVATPVSAPPSSRSSPSTTGDGVVPGATGGPAETPESLPAPPVRVSSPAEPTRRHWSGTPRRSPYHRPPRSCRHRRQDVHRSSTPATVTSRSPSLFRSMPDAPTCTSTSSSPLLLSIQDSSSVASDPRLMVQLIVPQSMSRRRCRTSG